MTSYSWLQLGVLVAILLVTTRVLGAYIAGVFGGGSARGDRVFAPIERVIYRICGVDPTREQTWPVYAFALIAFSLVSVLGLYALQRLQGHLPLNPTDAGAVPPALAFNTAASFVTNTNWQNYGGELTMSHLTQMAGLAVQNFVSAAVGLCVAVALIRGLRSAQVEDDRQLLGRPHARHAPPPPAARDRLRARPREPGRRPELPRLHDRANAAGSGAVDPGRPGGEPGGHQGDGPERWRLLQRQLRPPVREPERAHAISSRSCSS